MIKFEWNQTKALNNVRKHGISFEEAVQFFDKENSDSEDRFLMLGRSDFANVLIVCHCERDDGEKIRLISAIKATKGERKFYEGEFK